MDVSDNENEIVLFNIIMKVKHRKLDNNTDKHGYAIFHCTIHVWGASSCPLNRYQIYNKCKVPVDSYMSISAKKL